MNLWSLMLTPRHSLDVRELMSEIRSKWKPRLSQSIWKMSTQGGRKMNSTSVFPPKDAKICSFWWEGFLLRWKTSATGAIQSLYASLIRLFSTSSSVTSPSLSHDGPSPSVSPSAATPPLPTLILRALSLLLS